MTHPQVYFYSCKEYTLESLLPALKKVIQPFQTNLPKEGARILLKPNLLKGFPPETAVVTHPTFIEAIILIGKEFGWNIKVGDSPAISSVESVAETSGLKTVLDKHNIPLIAFKETESVKTEKTKVGLYAQLKNYDAIINLPKLKGHCQMHLTAAVKNCFGCVTGKRKAFLHMKLGDKDDQKVFSQMILDVAREVAPILNIIDGIISLAGNGPVNGEPVQTNFIAASDDALALDLALLDELKANKNENPIYRHINTLNGVNQSQNYKIEWLNKKSDVSAFYFPKERKPISFHPFILIRYAFRILLYKFIKPKHQFATAT